MALYCYLKSSPILPSTARQNRFLPILLMALGGLILFLVLGSMGVYQLRSQKYFQRKMLFNPANSQNLVLGKSQQNLNPTDLTKPSQWFTNSPSFPFQKSQITHYNLSIPVLGIHQAVVEIGGEDLGKSMIHYPGTSLPGQIGNAVIFCHSVLPQFFNPQNYKTICSTLPTIKIGEEIIINFDGVEYHYQVVEMFEVQPTDTSVLDQNLAEEYLSMITCVPPGTFLRRLVVRARLI